MDAAEKRYLELLSCSYPTIEDASAAVAQMNAALCLPKGTELFASDIHGEYNAFSHILRNGCGAVRAQIDEAFSDSLSEGEKKALATLVYYPEERLAFELMHVEDEQAFYADALVKLAALARVAARGHARAQVRALLPEGLAFAAEELMSAGGYRAAALPGAPADERAEAYTAAVIASVIEADAAADLIVALCNAVQRLNVSRLHLVGDIYDRGPAPQRIMDMLMEYPSVDIEWGNHDIVWMGAALGQEGCIAHVVRNCARYGNLSILEEAYGINLRPLAEFAMDAYADDPCAAFGLKGNPGLSPEETELNVKIQKAMAIIQFKVEARLIDEYPSFGLEDRKLLGKIDREAGTVVVDGIEYALTDTVFPTVDPADPYRMTAGERAAMDSLVRAFTECEKLQRHMRFLLEEGSLYRISGNTLMFHACVPLNADGSLLETDVFGETYKGRALYDVMERYVRAAFDDADPAMRKRGRDLMWYMWLGQGSPLFAKSKMATFELYLIADKAARKEVKNPYYSLLEDKAVMGGIFEDFGMNPESSRIVCGHTPVKVKDGEDPVKCDGRVVIIDGGFSSAYQPTTGIAGFTLVSGADGVALATHEPLASHEAAVEECADIRSTMRIIEPAAEPIRVADTDYGKAMREFADDLEGLVAAYRIGEIDECC